MDSMPAVGQMKNMTNFSRLCKYLGKTGTKCTITSGQGVAHKQGHMHKSTSISFKGKELKKPNRNSYT